MTLGIAYPLKIIKGQLVTASDVELAYQHILSVIQTETFERLGLINFGLSDYTFLSYPDFLTVANNIREKLEKYVPECGFNVVGNLEDNGVGLIEIYWTYFEQNQETIFLRFE